MELMYKLECSGEDFYNLLADRIGNHEAAVLLRRNGKEELGHARRIAVRIAIKQGHEFVPTPELQSRVHWSCRPTPSIPPCCRSSSPASRPATLATKGGPTTRRTPRSHGCSA